MFVPITAETSLSHYTIRLLVCLRSITLPTTESQNSLFCCSKNPKGGPSTGYRQCSISLPWHQCTFVNYKSDFLEGQLGFQILFSKQWISTGADFASQGYLAMSRDNVSCHNVGWGILLVCSEQRPGMQLSIRQCPGQSHSKECQQC